MTGYGQHTPYFRHYVVYQHGDHVEPVQALSEIARLANREGVRIESTVQGWEVEFARLTTTILGVGLVLWPVERFDYLQDGGFDLVANRPRIDEGHLLFAVAEFSMRAPLVSVARVSVNLTTMAPEIDPVPLQPAAG
jgi:hypothetical protein